MGTIHPTLFFQRGENLLLDLQIRRLQCYGITWNREYYAVFAGVRDSQLVILR